MGGGKGWFPFFAMDMAANNLLFLDNKAMDGVAVTRLYCIVLYICT